MSSKNTKHQHSYKPALTEFGYKCRCGDSFYALVEMDDLKLLRTKEVASLLGVHWQTVLSLIRGGKLEVIKLNKGYRIRANVLQKFMLTKKG